LGAQWGMARLLRLFALTKVTPTINLAKTTIGVGGFCRCGLVLGGVFPIPNPDCDLGVVRSEEVVGGGGVPVYIDHKIPNGSFPRRPWYLGVILCAGKFCPLFWHWYFFVLCAIVLVFFLSSLLRWWLFNPGGFGGGCGWAPPHHKFPPPQKKTFQIVFKQFPCCSCLCAILSCFVRAP